MQEQHCRDAGECEQLSAALPQGQEGRSLVAAGWRASMQAEPTAEIFANQNAVWFRHKLLHQQLVLA